MKLRRTYAMFSILAIAVLITAGTVQGTPKLPQEVPVRSALAGHSSLYLTSSLLTACVLAILFTGALRSFRARHRSSGTIERTNSVIEGLRDGIRDRDRMIDVLARSEQFLSTIFDSFHDPFCIIDRDFRIVKLNDAYARMKDRLPADLSGQLCYGVLHGRTGACEGCIVEKTIQSGDPCAKEKSLTLPDGTGMWIEIYTYPIFDRQRTVTHVIEYARDITDRKRVEEEKKQLIRTLNQLSTTDGLTGLLNRRALNDMLRHEIDRAVRYDANLSIILCDVDRFKKINDTFGHTAGDRALTAIAGTIQRSLRKADILGRYGGDEFLVILPETSIQGARSLAEKLRHAVQELDFRTADGDEIRLSISEGVASCCSPMEDIDTLVALADTALYTAKRSGRNTVSVLSR